MQDFCFTKKHNTNVKEQFMIEGAPMQGYILFIRKGLKF
jgi:hypothetical protein